MFDISTIWTFVQDNIVATLVGAVVVASLLFLVGRFLNRRAVRILNWISPLGVTAWRLIRLRLGGIYAATYSTAHTLQNSVRSRINSLRQPKSRKRIKQYWKNLFLQQGKPGSDPIETYPWFYFVAILLLAYAWYWFGNRYTGATITVFGHAYDQVSLIHLCGIAHFLTGTRVVDRSHVAGVLVVGRPTIEISGFIVIAPWLLFKFVIYPLAPIEIKVPRASNKVWRGKTNVGRPEGYEEPVRIVFAGKKWEDIRSDNKLMSTAKLKKSIMKDSPLLKQATEEVSFIIRLAIRRATSKNTHGFFDFYVRVGTLLNAHRQVKPVGMTELGEMLTKYSIAEVLPQTDWFNQQFLTKLDLIFASWGVDVVTAKMMLGLSPSVNKAMEDALEAVAVGQQKVTLADATKIELTRLGEGRGAALEAELDGRGKGLRKMKNESGITDANVVIAAEVASDIAKGPNSKYYLPFGDLAKVAGMLLPALKGNNTP